MSKMKVALKDIVDSPFRDFKLNPLREKALAALEESFEATGYWGNAVLRKLPSGKYELIAGHHRVKLLKKQNSKDHDAAFEFEITNLTDAQVQKRMARDHHPAFNHDVTDMVERVQSAVRSLAAGEITAKDWPAPDPKTNKAVIRHAPSYIAGRTCAADSAAHPYTANTLAVFLGSTKRNKDGVTASDAVIAALAFLENIELKLWSEKDLATFRNDKGEMPVEKVLKGSEDKQYRAKLTAAREAQKAEDVRLQGEDIKARIERETKEKQRLQEEDERLHKQEMEATRKEDEERAEKYRAQQKENARLAAVSEEKRLIAQIEWDANQNARKASLEAQRQDKINAAKRMEAQRASHIKSFVETLDRMFDGDGTYDLTKTTGKDKRTRPEEHAEVIRALEELSDRVLQARVFHRPEIGKKIGKISIKS